MSKGFDIICKSDKGRAFWKQFNIKDKKIIISIYSQEPLIFRFLWLHRFRFLPMLRESTEFYICKLGNDNGILRGVDYDIRFF
jgi:hypothetical protein